MDISAVILAIGLIIESCVAFDPLPARENFRNAIADCKNKIDINEDEMHNVMRHIIPKTKNEQCMVACLEKKIGIMGDDNKISMDKVQEKFARMKQHREDMYNEVMKNIEECRALETTETDECVAGRKFAECMFPKITPFRPPRHFAPHFSNRYIAECKNKTGIHENEFRNYIMRQIPETKNEQCMLACTEKRIGYIGADNKINITKVEQHLVHMNKTNPELYHKILDIYTDCQAVETIETDECVAARNYAKCVFPKQKQLHPARHIGKA
ncbi:Odorant-binding protein 19d [Carabus blaptoides fortunei]